jgi:hypothetical protein
MRQLRYETRVIKIAILHPWRPLRLLAMRARCLDWSVVRAGKVSDRAQWCGCRRNSHRRGLQLRIHAVELSSCCRAEWKKRLLPERSCLIRAKTALDARVRAGQDVSVRGL